MTRSIVVKKRVELGPLAYGWDDCYMVFSAMTKQDQDVIASKKDSQVSNDEAEAFLNGYLKDHFISGKIRVTEEDKESLVDATKDDIDLLPIDMLADIFQQVTVGGGKYAHPKV